MLSVSPEFPQTSSLLTIAYAVLALSYPMINKTKNKYLELDTPVNGTIRIRLRGVLSMT